MFATLQPVTLHHVKAERLVRELHINGKQKSFNIFLIFLIESPEPQQCTDDQCQEPECQYNLQQQQLQQEQLQQQHQLHQIIQQPIQTQPHIHQIHYTYSRRTSLDSNALDVCCLFLFYFAPKIFVLLIFYNLVVPLFLSLNFTCRQIN